MKSINQRLDTEVNSNDLATTTNNLDDNTRLLFNANSTTFLTMLTLTNSSIQSELDIKADLDNMVSGFTNIILISLE